MKRRSPTIITTIMAGGATGITIITTTTIIGGAGIITITTTTITITKVVHRGGRGTSPASAGNGGSSFALLCFCGAKEVAIRAVEHGVGVRRPGAIGCQRGAAGVNPPPPHLAFGGLFFLHRHQRKVARRPGG